MPLARVGVPTVGIRGMDKMDGGLGVKPDVRAKGISGGIGLMETMGMGVIMGMVGMMVRFGMEPVPELT